MTLTMIIIIVAGVVLIAFGVLCIVSIAKAQKETRAFNERMRAMENDLDQIGKMVRKVSVDSQARLEQVQMQSEKAAVRKTPEEKPVETTEPGLDHEESISIDDLLDDFEDVLPDIYETPAFAGESVEPAHKPLPEMPYAEEITFNEIPEYTPQIQHFDYDIGRSGKRYTASELESLIRE